MRGSCALAVGGRTAVAILIAMSTSILVTAACGQQVIPFGDVPATPDFTEHLGERETQDVVRTD